jgi:predicted TIM-barrel fold metal-dependent hydrolase
MAREYRYVSGDAHLEIDSKWWIERVPAKHRDRAPRLVRLPDGGDAWLIEGLPLREVPSDLYAGKGRDQWQPIGQNYETTPGTGSPQQRLHEQDVDGIDAEVLFPGVSGPPLWSAIDDPEAQLAIVRAYNDFLAEEYCAADRDRLIGLGVIPWTGIDDAVAELERCARVGLRGVHLGVFPNGKGAPSPEDDRFWAAALALNMPITVHEEFNRAGKRAGPLLEYRHAPPEYRRRLIGNINRELAGQVSKFSRLGFVNAVQLALDGVFDRFPDLKIFFAETQIGWIPFALEMADVRFERHQHWAQELLGWEPMRRHALPSEYIREHCYWGFQHDFVGVENRHHINVDRLIWAVDFPHQDSEWPNSLQLLERQFADVPAAEKRKMTAQNAIDFFHLDAMPARQDAKRNSASAG